MNNDAIFIYEQGQPVIVEPININYSKKEIFWDEDRNYVKVECKDWEDENFEVSVYIDNLELVYYGKYYSVQLFIREVLNGNIKSDKLQLVYADASAMYGKDISHTMRTSGMIKYFHQRVKELFTFLLEDGWLYKIGLCK